MSPLDSIWSVDLYRVVIFPLLTTGVNKGGIMAVDETAYEGVEVLGPVSWEPNFGSPRTFANVSQGKVNDTIIKASIDPKTAALKCSYDSSSLAALLTGINIVTMGGGKIIGMGTEKEGKEIQCAVMVQTDGHDEDDNPVYITDVYHRASLVPTPVSHNDNPIVKEYPASLSRTGIRTWGEPLSLTTHGHITEVYSHDITEGIRNLIGWLGDNVATAFTLPTDKPALTSAKAVVWDFLTGAEIDGAWDATENATTFTPTTKPTEGQLLACTYEF